MSCTVHEELKSFASALCASVLKLTCKVTNIIPCLLAKVLHTSCANYTDLIDTFNFKQLLFSSKNNPLIGLKIKILFSLMTRVTTEVSLSISLGVTTISLDIGFRYTGTRSWGNFYDKSLKKLHIESIFALTGVLIICLHISISFLQKKA